jgi:hypothetical protein
MRANRWQVYSYLLHVVLDNAEIQGHRKSFSLRDTEPTRYQINEPEAYHILKDLNTSGILSRAEGHCRKWNLTNIVRERLAKIPSEQRFIIAKKMENALTNELVLRFKFHDLIRQRVYEAFGFDSTDILTFERLYSGQSRTENEIGNAENAQNQTKEA